MDYVSRVVDTEVESRLETTGGVVLEGPKAVGKTATGRRFAASEVLLDVDRAAQAAAAVDPGLVLDGPTPRLIDEWQTEPGVWNHARRVIDDRGTPGQFLLTGSAVPTDDVDRHTGAGRFSFVRMRPMTLFEAGLGTGAISVRALFDGHTPAAPDLGVSVRDIAELIVIGGWPLQRNSEPSRAGRAHADYLEQVRSVDISRIGDVRRDPVRVGRLMAALARSTATEAKVTTLAADVGGDDGPAARSTIVDYLDALERLMVTEDQAAWAPPLRSKARLRTAPKRHFIDPSLAAAALAAGPDRLLTDIEWMGQLFESLVVRDLRVLAQPLGGHVLHYRDSNGLEVDAIVELSDGRWGAVEIKLGQSAIDDAARTLVRFSATVDTERVGPPSFLAVVCATGYGFRRDDGVVVLPVAALAP